MTITINKTALAASLALTAFMTFATACDERAPSPFIDTALAAEPESTAARSGNKPAIVLVHGAWADATGWQAVIPLLQQKGYDVIAVENPLISYSIDVQTTKRVIEAKSKLGPVVVVGHSYGGAVITNAAAGNPNVKALVYVAAFGPEAGEPIGALLEKYPSPLGKAIVPDTAGFLYIDSSKFRDVFAADVPAPQARTMAVAQKPLAGDALGQSSPVTAWKTIPSWYLVAQQDKALNPDLERFYANRMNARTTEIGSSHVPFVSHPREVAKLIEQAAEATSK